ncbi:hypothetical protein JVU11DRAFT_4090 [Chiua virens]|nr:hypothetical protein JVU11DRAFT_4090 [Chiua virens]
MFTTFFSFSLLLSLSLSVHAFSIDTPQLVQCQPAQITWTDSGNPPYDLLVVPANDMCGEALEDLGNSTSLAVTWTVNLAAGTQIVLSLEDAANNDAWSGTVTVGSSNDASCLASSPSSALPSSSVSGTAPTTVTPSRAATTLSVASYPSSSAFAPAGAANAGLLPNSSGSDASLSASDTLRLCCACPRRVRTLSDQDTMHFYSYERKMVIPGISMRYYPGDNVPSFILHLWSWPRFFLSLGLFLIYQGKFFRPVLEELVLS